MANIKDFFSINDTVSLAIYVCIIIIVYTIIVITIIALHNLWNLYYHLIDYPDKVGHKNVNFNNPFILVVISILTFIEANRLILYPLLFIFGCALMFLILLYVIYYFCLALVILAWLTEIPPLKTLKRLKVVDLFDNIVGIIFNTKDNALAKAFRSYLITLDFSYDFMGISELEIENPLILENFTYIKETFADIKKNMIEFDKIEKGESSESKKCPIGKVLNSKTGICVKNNIGENVIEGFSNKDNNILDIKGNFINLKNKIISIYKNRSGTANNDIIEGFSKDDSYSFVDTLNNSYSNDNSSLKAKGIEEEEKYNKLVKSLDKCIVDLDACKAELGTCNANLQSC
jgi:hypothetical protein